MDKSSREPSIRDLPLPSVLVGMLEDYHPRWLA